MGEAQLERLARLLAPGGKRRDGPLAPGIGGDLLRRPARSIRRLVYDERRRHRIETVADVEHVAPIADAKSGEQQCLGEMPALSGDEAARRRPARRRTLLRKPRI